MGAEEEVARHAGEGSKIDTEPRGQAKCRMRNGSIFLITFLCLLAITQGCGSSTTTPGQNGSHAVPCTIVLSGALTATLSCTAAVVYDSQKNVTAIALAMSSTTPNSTSATVGLKYPGPTGLGSHSDADTGVVCGATAMKTDSVPPLTWVMSQNPSKMGAMSVTISDLGASMNGNNGIAYVNPHGSANATLVGVQESEANGIVTLHATF